MLEMREKGGVRKPDMSRAGVFFPGETGKKDGKQKLGFAERRKIYVTKYIVKCDITCLNIQKENHIMNTSNITNYKPKDFAELLGISVKTLQRWDREGILKANRTPTDRRYYTYDQYLQFKGINIENDKRQAVIYARVSTKNQKDDLQNQVAFLRQFCNARGIIVDQCIEEYGSGLNYNRKKWNKLLDEVMEQKVKTIIITHKDRFIRFGYDWFEKFCMKFNTTIVVVNNEELSPQEELVQDIVSILHVFSCRLYGLRKYKKQIERDEEIAKELQDGNPSDRRAESQDS